MLFSFHQIRNQSWGLVFQPQAWCRKSIHDRWIFILFYNSLARDFLIGFVLKNALYDIYKMSLYIEPIPTLLKPNRSTPTHLKQQKTIFWSVFIGSHLMLLKDDIMLSIPFSSLLQAKCIYFFPFFLFDIVLDSRKNISYNRALLPFWSYHFSKLSLHSAFLTCMNTCGSSWHFFWRTLCSHHNWMLRNASL